MQIYRRGGALLASLTVLTLAGCHSGSNGSSGTIELNNNSPVATVNGQSITQEEFFTQLQDYRPTQQTLGLPAGQTVLRQLINGVLVEELAQKQGVAPTDTEVDALYNTQKASAEVQSVKTFDQLLSENGITPDDVKNFQLKPELASLNIIQKETGSPAITDAAISAYYAQHKAQYTAPNRAHIKRIVVTNAADAQRIYSQIQKGQPFSSFVSQSVDHTFPDGDVPDWVNLDAPPPPQLVPPAMLPAIKKAAAHAGNTAASVTPPYGTQNAFWIVQVVETRQKQVIPLDQVKEAIKFILMLQQVQQNPSGGQALQQQIADFQSKAKITIPDPRYAPLLAALTAPPPPTPTLSVPSGAPPPTQGAPPSMKSAPKAKH